MTRRYSLDIKLSAFTGRFCFTAPRLIPHVTIALRKTRFFRPSSVCLSEFLRELTFIILNAIKIFTSTKHNGPLLRIIRKELSPGQADTKEGYLTQLCGQKQQNGQFHCRPDNTPVSHTPKRKGDPENLNYISYWRPRIFSPSFSPPDNTPCDNGNSDVSLARIVSPHYSRNRYFKLHHFKEIVSDCFILLCAHKGRNGTGNCELSTITVDSEV